MSRPVLRSLLRKTPTRETKRQFWIFCEGQNTERAYFDAVKALWKDALVSLQIVAGVGEPRAVARAATEKAKEVGVFGKKHTKKDSFEKNDEVWAVFDHDDGQHHHFNSAVEECRTHKVGVGWSVPCFEHWLILHFEDADRGYDRHAAQKSYGKMDPSYKPKSSKTPDCKALVANIERAETRANQQAERRLQEGSQFGNPSTNVQKLTAKIREAAALSAKR
jgi:RloB-like protein